MPTDHVIGVDAGTTGITVVAYDAELRPQHRAYAEFTQHYPQPGWVEHDPEEIRDVAVRLVAEVGARVSGAVAAVGITNQRETVMPFDVDAGRAVHRAIVWQCRRTADLCAALKEAGHEPVFRAKTGLLLDPYFSGTKMRWLLEHGAGVSEVAERGALRFTTVDAFLVHALTGGAALCTDPTNASRTLLFDIDTAGWDADLCRRLGVDPSMLPPVQPSVSQFGETDPDVVGFRAPVSGIAGDQQAALFGQGCFDAGTAKNTYGTGCFLLLNAGDSRPEAPDGILTTLAVGADGAPAYALEGAVFVAGAAVQWLRDGLGIIADAAETEELAAGLEDNGGVYLVPAFTGLGAPHWNPDARGLICGLTRGTGRAHLARAALESIAFQVNDLFRLFATSSGLAIPALRVDGGAATNDWLMRFQAGLLGVPVVRGGDLETTCRGAALLAALGAGVVSDPREVGALAEDLDRMEGTMDAGARERLLGEWARATERTL